MVAKRKTSTAAKLKGSAVMAVSMSVDPDVRRQLVAAEAYFRAERRGFVGGNELDDWVAAEVAVDSRIQAMHQD
ncbi:MAG: DUF2934 domain-containing protein [Steroidobacteraceae bacterium]